MPDHVHLLIDLGRETSISTLLREIKAKSSQWLKSKLNGTFSWQGGYGAFSVSPTHVENVIGCIRNQEEHHRRKTFVEELEEMLRVAGIEYEPKYLWQKEES